MNKILQIIRNILKSNKFFIFILIFFFIESAWIAVSAAYPQAFDEDFHFGIINIYTNHLNPFLGSQPINGDRFGALARDPSYLYQYLLNFPLRITKLFTKDILIQVYVLRFINIGLAVSALVIFSKVLKRAKISKTMINLILFLFVLIPIVPQLAGQINYDNLLLPLIAWVLLISFDLLDQIKKYKIKARTLLSLIIICSLASLVKFVFLPIFATIFMFMVIYIYIKHKKRAKKLWLSFIESFRKETLYIRIVLVSLLFISVGMFIQRDGVNLLKYHTVEPNCSQVISKSECKSYGPWEYNYVSHSDLLNSKAHGYNPIRGIFYFANQWLYWMWFRLFFAINGPDNSFANYPPLPLPSAAALGIFGISILLFLRYIKVFFKDNLRLFLLFAISIIYLLALFIQGFISYRYTNVLENMNGRYLLPVIIPLAGVLSVGFSLFFKKFNRLKVLVALILIFLFIQGGGFLTFIDRSDDTWDVPNSVIRQLNKKARHITNPVIINGNKYYYTYTWFFN